MRAKQRETIRSIALDLGFDAVGFASAVADPADRQHLERFVAEGRHGDMEWLAADPVRRSDPQALWPAARSVVVCALNYGPANDPRAEVVEPRRGLISVYARGRDYHDVMKRKLKQFARKLTATLACQAKVFVDTAPVMEKPLAQRAGIGWIGKHTNLVSRRFGSWLFLGEVFTTLEIEPDPAETDHCGSCNRCRQACPTAALPQPYRIEPRRCISYLTIEHREAVPLSLASAFGNRIYGCDDCLSVCPWNRFAEATPHEQLRPRSQVIAPALDALAEIDDAAFRDLTRQSAIRRIGRSRFLRNVAIARGNAAMTAETE